MRASRRWRIRAGALSGRTRTLFVSRGPEALPRRRRARRAILALAGGEGRIAFIDETTQAHCLSAEGCYRIPLAPFTARIMAGRPGRIRAIARLRRCQHGRLPAEVAVASAGIVVVLEPDQDLCRTRGHGAVLELLSFSGAPIRVLARTRASLLSLVAAGPRVAFVVSSRARSEAEVVRNGGGRPVVVARHALSVTVDAGGDFAAMTDELPGDQCGSPGSIWAVTVGRVGRAGRWKSGGTDPSGGIALARGRLAYYAWTGACWSFETTVAGRGTAIPVLTVPYAFDQPIAFDGRMLTAPGGSGIVLARVG